MKKHQPFFSVIIPVYNRKELLMRALDSVLSQTYKSFEVIIIDDNSTDGTREWLQTLKNEQVIYLSNTKSKGACGARNVGIDFANGEFVAFLDSDDWWDNNKLQITYNYICDNLYYHVFYSSCYYVNKDGDLNPIPTKKVSGEILSALGRMNPIRGFSSLVVKRDTLRIVSGFDESLPARQDVDLYFRLSKYAKFFYIPELLVFISFNNHQKISANKESRLNGWIMVYNKHKSKMKKADQYYQEKRIFYLACKLYRYDLVFTYLPGAMISILEKFLKIK